MTHLYNAAVKKEWGSSLCADMKLFVRYIIEWKVRSAE